jgi:hypothetical protein
MIEEPDVVVLRFERFDLGFDEGIERVERCLNVHWNREVH